MRWLLLTSILLFSSTAFSQSADIQASDSAQVDSGFRLHAAMGYPSIVALGVGWKSAGGTEVLAQAGGIGLWAMLVGSAETSISHDIVKKPWGILHAGLAASILHTHAFVIDCYEPEGCGDDFIQDLYFASPRLGLRLRLDRRKRRGVLPYLELSAGPQVGLCRGSCDGGRVLVNAAVQVRVVLDWAKRTRG